MDAKKVGAFIRTQRCCHNLTQEQLAALLDVSHKSISKWENGLCLPSPDRYDDICKVFDITTQELLEGEEHPQQILLKMLKHKLYLCSDQSVSYDDFSNALDQMANTYLLLKRFSSKEEAVSYLVKETKEDKETCAQAYDFYIKMFTYDD